MLFSSCFSLPLFAEVKFNKLTSCSEIRYLYNYVKENQKSGSWACRRPRGSLERELLDSNKFLNNGDCFIVNPPLEILNGFSCFRGEHVEGGSVACFRKVKNGIVDEYKENYEKKYAGKLINYYREASKCEVSNGDVTSMPKSLYPMIFKFISRFEFGFISSLGNGKLPDGHFTHGYAKLSKVNSGKSNEIEFIYIGAGFSLSTNNPDKIINTEQWTINLYKNEDDDREHNKTLRKLKVPLAAFSHRYSFEANHNNVNVKKDSFISEIFDEIVDSLEYEEFEVISHYKFEKLTGVSPLEYIDEMRTSIPSGSHESEKIIISEDIRFLISLNRPSCARKSEDSIILISLTGIVGKEEIKSDYGNVDILAMTTGECMRTRAITRKTKSYINRIFSEVTNELTKYLNSY